MPYLNYYIITDGDFKEKREISKVKQRNDKGWVTEKFLSIKISNTKYLILTLILITLILIKKMLRKFRPHRKK